MKKKEVKKPKIVRNTNNNSTRSVPFLELLEEKKKRTIREKKLENLTWGMGIEHETQFFYVPTTIYHPKKPIYPLKESVVIATQLPAQELYEYDTNLLPSDKKLLEKIDYEETGRRCGGKIILDKLTFEYDGKKQPLRMPEFITEEPFSTLKNAKNIFDYVSEIIEKERRFIYLIENANSVEKFIKENFLAIRPYPFGMCSDIRVRKDYTSDLKTLEKKHFQDYTGSYHYTVTLPFEKKEKYTEEDEKKFVDMHYNFGAMFQWIEPLLLAAYFSCDQKSVGTNQKRIRGSFRVARVGWGNFAGSDMRKKNEDVGVGRYANVEPYWRDNFKFHESNKTEACRSPHWQEDQAISSFSSNIRTFGPDPSKPDDPKARISGAKMTIPNGMEIRIFDHFSSYNLLSLLQIIILVAANSKRVNVKEYVYKDKEWIQTIQKIMLEGWKAEVNPLFIKKLENIMDIQFKYKSLRAYDVLAGLVDELYNVNKDSDIVYLMYGPLMRPKIPMINKYSWDFAFLLKMDSDKKIRNKFLELLLIILDKNTVKDFNKAVSKIFGKVWNKNALDILYFCSTKKILSLNEKGNEYKINNKMVKEIVENIEFFIKFEILIQLDISKLANEIKNADKFPAEKYREVKEIKNRFKDLYNIDLESKYLQHTLNWKKTLPNYS